MKFRKWIETQGGPIKVGRLVGLNKYTIYAWLYRGISPTAKNMIKLVKLGKGAFDYEDIVLETQNKRGPSHDTTR